ncbi:MAG: winged helix-turn-helix domain-containing protein [Alphaproteobacteria bacterium]
MIYRFGEYELDTAKLELRGSGSAVSIEPQVFALLRLLIENRERALTKDEIIERVWDGRFISDAAVASRIKSARQAIGDDGRAQGFIKTLHGIGFRFVADVTEVGPTRVDTYERVSEAPNEIAKSVLEPSSRPSIAVLPFRLVGVAGPYAGIADALPDDLITELSKLRWLFVIARASTFRFRDEDADIDHVRSVLNVRYCLSGVVEILGSSMAVSVELADTESRGVIWRERFKGNVGAVHEIREEIGRAVISAMELQIPLNEARLARLKSPQHLDAWSAYHLGLHHMYRFTKGDNALATSLFERASKLEPGFARAYAGLSFTHFQDAFLRYTTDLTESARLARHFAEQSLEYDPVDPFGNFTMGRVFLLSRDLEGSLEWLQRANALSPNYAQAKYSRGWTEAMLGSARDSIADVDAAMALSPLDPLRYAMLSVRGFSHILLGEYADAADWAERSANSPGAHPLIDMIASVAHGLNGDDAKARARAVVAKTRAPHLTKDDFFRAFPFRNEAAKKRMAVMLTRYGF